MNDFKFDEETHIYTLGGVKLPSVTQILRPLYDFSAVHPDVLARAAAYGTACHKCVELYLHDDLDENTLDAGLIGPLMAFKQWESDYPAIISGIGHIERPCYHAKLHYAGTPDLEGDAVIDLKSRKCKPAIDCLQLSAYDNMTGNGKRDHYVLELKQDGSYVFTRLNATVKERQTSWSKFRYLLDFHNMKAEINRWKEC